MLLLQRQITKRNDIAREEKANINIRSICKKYIALSVIHLQLMRLREYIDAHYEVEKDSISKIVRKADADLSSNHKNNIFSKVKTIFTRGK